MSSTQQKLGAAYQESIIEELTKEILTDINKEMLAAMDEGYAEILEKEKQENIIARRKEMRREERIAKRDALRAKQENESKNRILDSLGGGLGEDDDDHCGFSL